MPKDRINCRQAEIEIKKAAAVREYPALWRRVISEWTRPEDSDRAWLLYSANYLFRTAGIRWALDPIRLRQRLPSAPEMDISALARLEVVVLSHHHNDHLDLDLLARLRDLPLLWIVPEFLLESLHGLSLPKGQLTVPRAMVPIDLGSLILTPFNGLHWESAPERPGGLRGVPAMGYLAEFSGKRWLLPGDVRTFDPGQVAVPCPMEGVFAHIWLGRNRAFDPRPELLDAFCSFHLAFQPKRIILTHIDEYGRPPGNYWDGQHSQVVREWFAENAPGIGVETAGHGDCVEL